MKIIRVGTGAGYAGDRIQPAIDLLENVCLDYVVFECLAERTIALAQQRKSCNPSHGYDPMLEDRMRRVLPACRRHGTRLVSNMGAANPIAAAAKTCEIAESLGIGNLKIAAITGDDVLHLVRRKGAQTKILETGLPVSSLGETLISANAYIGAEPIVEALRNGAHIVLGGRIADPALFLAPLQYEFGWSTDNYEMLGRGILVGHLLECAAQLTGGYFADPPYKRVPGLAHLGFPFADVGEDGSAEFSKWCGSGGEISVATCKEQLLYEVHDPHRYLTPDVIAEFSNVEFRQLTNNRVGACGASGTTRPATLKVSLGVDEGYLADAQISYAGAGAEDRARLAIDIVKEQLLSQQITAAELRCEMIGIDSVAPPTHPTNGNLRDIRVRIAARTCSEHDARQLTEIIEALYTNGPAAGGGASKSVRPIVAILSCLQPREEISAQIHYQVTRS